jgi:hypothetical protein
MAEFRFGSFEAAVMIAGGTCGRTIARLGHSRPRIDQHRNVRAHGYES